MIENNSTSNYTVKIKDITDKNNNYKEFEVNVLSDFESITKSAPGQSAGWTCLAWLQLLCGQEEKALRSARLAVKLNTQDPQARINLSLALLATKSKGVRDQIDFVKRLLVALPEIEKELKISMERLDIKLELKK